jgi:hypothetical protein
MTLTAILLSASMAAAAVDQNACGIPGARQVFVFPPYSDHELHRVKVDEGLDLDIQSPLNGPVDLRDATSGALVHSMAREQWDGYLKRPNGELPESDGSVVKIAISDGTLVVDPSSTLSREGGFMFMCWKPNKVPVALPSHHIELYQGIELSEDGAGVIRRHDGSTLPVPVFRYQVQVEGTGVSEDGRRVGWLVDMPNCCTSYEVPKILVIFKNGNVERIFDEGQCIFDWAFVRKGAAVAYYTSVLHGSDFKSFFLRDIRTGALLATYDYPESGYDQDPDPARSAAIAAAPAWVRAISSSDR